MKYNKLKFEEIKNWKDERWIEEIMSNFPLSGDFKIDSAIMKIYHEHCEIDTTNGLPDKYESVKGFFETAFSNKRGGITGSVYSCITNRLLELGLVNYSNVGGYVITEEGKIFKTKQNFVKYNEYKQKKEKAEERNIRFGFHFSVIGLIIGLLTLITLVATYFKN